MDLEVWGGVECSINRVGAQWFNQLQASGHDSRLQDLELIAGLGLTTVRYPVLWEVTAPHAPGEIHWSFADERLHELRRLRINPIVGLLHHGSGPHYTSLIDPRFPGLFAQYAGKVARRFPWVRDYTPINEPLTTARFSGLYGHWYPHHRNDRTFVRALINQCRATVLAMRSIREVNPEARLVQTEDLGTTHSTKQMSYQARFDNERRWLTWDLLTGRVADQHPLKIFLLENGITEQELEWFVRQGCAPQLIGINHYVTSDRYLDQRISNYPNTLSGANAVETYVDVEAVRVLDGPYAGWRVIGEAWRRYQLPIALTEVHLACTDDERLIWLNDARNEAFGARADGCDVRAITAWALFGSSHWDRLLRDQAGTYEAGAFRIAQHEPHATPVAQIIQRFARHPAERFCTAEAGWWQRAERTLYSRQAAE